MIALSYVLTGLSVAVFVFALIAALGRRVVAGYCGVSSGFCAQAVSLALRHAPSWEPIALISIAIVTLAVAVARALLDRPSSHDTEGGAS